MGLMACDGDAMRAVDYLLQESNHQWNHCLKHHWRRPLRKTWSKLSSPPPPLRQSLSVSLSIIQGCSVALRSQPSFVSETRAAPRGPTHCSCALAKWWSRQATKHRSSGMMLFKNDVQLPVVCASSAVPKLHPGEVANVTVELHTGSLTKGSSCSVEYSLHNPDVKDMAQSCVAVKGGPLRVTLVVASSHATTSYGSGTTTTTSASYVATDVADIAYAASSSGGNSSYVAASAASAAAGSCSMEGTLYATTNATTAQYASTAETTGPYAAATGGTP